MNEMFLKIIESSIYASFLILVVFILRGIFSKKAPKWTMCILWALVGIKLLVPITIESDFGVIPPLSMEYKAEEPMSFVSSESPLESEISFESAEENDNVLESEEVFSRLEQESVESEEESFSPIFSAEESFGGAGVISQGGVSEGEMPSFEENVGEEAESKEIFLSKEFVRACGVVWIFGALLMLSYGVVQYVKLKKKVSVFSLYKEGIRKCEAIDSPFVLGIIKPFIYIPFNLSEKTEKYIIAHEKSHVQRFDYLSKIVAFVALSVHWFNPLVWISFSLFCKDVECACDEKVLKALDIEGKKDYASALLECSIKGSKISACPVAFGEIGVKERVKNIFSYKKPLLWIIILVVAICVALAFVFFTTPEKDVESSESIENSEIAESEASVESAQSGVSSEASMGEASKEDASNEDTSNEDTSNEDTSNEDTSNEDTSNEENESSSVVEKSIDLYVRNKDVTGFSIVNSTTNGDINDIIKQLIELKAIPDGTVSYSFNVKGKTAEIDLSKVFGESISTGALQEEMTMGCLFNTIIKFYKVDNVTFTVEGKILETGYNKYDFPIGFNHKVDKSIDLYVRNSDVTGFSIVKSTTNGEVDDIIRQLAELKAIPEGIVSYSFEVKGKTAEIDLSKAFGDAISSGALEEEMTMGCLFNTIIKFYKVDNVTFTVEGKILETGYNKYDFPIGLNDLVYELVDGNVLVISGTGNMINYPANGSFINTGFDNEKYKNIEKIIIKDGVTSVGNNAFAYCKKLKSVVFPETLEYIGVSAFAHCYELESVKLPQSVKTLSNYAFIYCNKLKSVEISPLTECGYHVFAECENLKTVNIANGAKVIGFGMFEECIKLENVVLPDSVEIIKDSAFLGCTSLEKITFSKNLKEIGCEAFRNCSKLKSIVLGNALEKIDTYAFFNCVALDEITIGGNVSSFGRYAFVQTAFCNDKSNWNGNLLCIGKYSLLPQLTNDGKGNATDPTEDASSDVE